MIVQFLHSVGTWGTLMLALAVLSACGENEAPDDELQPVKGPEVTRIVPAKQALNGAHVPTLDPATMYEAEIRKALERTPRCDFRYTTGGKPVLAFTLQQNGEASAGVVKLNGHLVVLRPALDAGSTEGNGEFLLAAEPVRMAVIPDANVQIIERRNAQRREANAIFEVGQSLRVGYRGYLDCTSEPPTISPRETSGR
jgi:hypothetical protein